MKNFSFLKKAILRTPLKPIDTDITVDKISEILLDPQIKEALFIASPSVHKIIEDRGELSEKLVHTLYKYYSRFSNRCTPFGLFASVGVLDIAPKTKISISNSGLDKSIKYDMLFLGKLTANLNRSKSIRKNLKFYPNNTIYKILNKYRYVEFYYVKEKRHHRISEAEVNSYLDEILVICKEGKSIAEICDAIVSDAITLKEAEDFINSLIDAQFLVSELDITLTGEDYLDHMITIFSEKRFYTKECEKVKELLSSMKNGLALLEKSEITSVNSYLLLYDTLKSKIDGEIDLSKLFQVDAHRAINESTLGFDVLKKLRSGVVALNKLSDFNENSSLESFKTEFLRRYENQSMPLYKVLDPDSGIGYKGVSGAKTPLIENLAIGNSGVNPQKITWDNKKDFLLQKALFAYQNNLSIVPIEEDELSAFDENPKLYPDSFSVFFNVIGDEGNEKVMIKSVSGPSANILIGRFGYLDDGILNISNEICRAESQMSPNKILAEIVHLPEARTGNILHRKFQRDFEIPYLAKSSLTSKNQIPINDLYVTVRNNKIVLFSEKLKKEIIPRLGNAHNYSFGSLPIYNFLCDIQNQDSTGFAFQWGRITSSFPFLPRLVYNNIILSLATWNLKKKEIQKLVANQKETIQKVRDFIKTKKIPDIVAFVEGDNDVIINFKNDLSCNLFYAMVKKKKFVSLQEVLMKNSPITENYSNEFIAFGVKDGPIKEFSTPLENLMGTSTSFPFGSNWLYYKLYCGTSMAEKVLVEAVTPIIDKLKELNCIEKWFFIRFNDQDGHHLRLRIKLKNIHDLPEVAKIVTALLNPFQEEKLVWKIQLDTYLPETERYGERIMEETESVFYNDSTCTLRFLDMIEGAEGEKIRWLFALLSIDYFLNDLDFSLDKKLTVLRIAKDAFGNEFNKGVILNKQVNKIFKENQIEIEGLLNRETIGQEYAPLITILQKRTEKNKAPLNKIKEFLLSRDTDQIKLNNSTIDHLHMICNRILLTKQREHEMVIYDLLHQYYKRQTFKKG